MKTIGIIGFGNMGEAMISGLLERNPDYSLSVIEKASSRRKCAVESYNAVDCTDDPEKLFTTADAVVLAIKPQDLPALGEEFYSYTEKLPLISIAAGVNLETLKQLFGSDQIARFMPSLAASVGKSVTGISYSPGCIEEFKDLSYTLAESFGLAMEMPERLIPAIIGISGSAIAYVYEFLNALALGGVKNGIKYESSLEVALDVLEGAVSTVRSSGMTPGELVTKVCSPGGTTIQGINSLHQDGFTATVIRAVDAAADRARDLEG